MLFNFKSFINKLTAKPKLLFLIDGIGAFLSAFLLLIILIKIKDGFGMPRSVLYFLFSLACIYTVYSFSCYLFILKKWLPFLKAVMWANTIYCCITIGLVIYFYQNLAIVGLTYFLLEIILLIGLILLELTVILRNPSY